MIGRISPSLAVIWNGDWDGVALSILMLGLTTFGSFPNLEISNWHLKSAICTSRFKNSRNTQLVVSGYRGGSSM